jgi:phage/plasmid-associated DNA primase
MLKFDRDLVAAGEGEKGIEERMIRTQGPAIFRWLVEGAVRLLARDEYALPASHFDAMKAWQETSDPVAEWIADACDVKDDAKDGRLTTELFPYFARWLKENGYRSVTLRTFGGNLNDAGFGKTGTRSKMRPLVPKTGHRVNELVKEQLQAEAFRARSAPASRPVAVAKPS